MQSDLIIHKWRTNRNPVARIYAQVDGAVTLLSIQRGSSPEVRTKSIELHSQQTIYKCALGMALGCNEAHFYIRQHLALLNLVLQKFGQLFIHVIKLARLQ